MKFILASMGVGLQELFGLIVGTAIFVGLFLLFRTLILWYWKVDKILENQQSQVRILQEMLYTMRKEYGKKEEVS